MGTTTVIERYELYRDGLKPRIDNKEKLVVECKNHADLLPEGMEKYYAYDEWHEQQRKLLDLKLEFNACNDWIDNYTKMINRNVE